MRFKALVHVRLRGSVSDAAGNAVMKNTHMVAPNLKPVSYTHLTLPTKA